MRDNLHDYRRSYEKGSLLKSTVDPNPLQQFRTWFHDVTEAGGVDEVNAMTLSTLGTDGYLRNRVVLLKKYDEFGFVFYTNYQSEKGRSIEAYPKVCLSFFWPNLERQVIVKGEAERVPEAESDNYFASRPKGSQLGALVSSQSEVIQSRDELEKELEALDAQYEEGEIPRPSDWGGYRVRPKQIEFWQGRPNRLHDRIRYRLEGLDWIIERLAP
jgi:pyridoxamine 5'-phosphate oxidase